ncbi:hypothetical protein [Roseivirga pacifica]
MNWFAGNYTTWQASPLRSRRKGREEHGYIGAECHSPMITSVSVSSRGAACLVGFVPKGTN